MFEAVSDNRAFCNDFFIALTAENGFGARKSRLSAMATMMRCPTLFNAARQIERRVGAHGATGQMISESRKEALLKKAYQKAPKSDVLASLEARGINRLFGHREDELVKHDPELAALLPKQEKPDAIYGLRPTRNLENLLNDSMKPQFSGNNREAHIEEMLQPSPFDETGEPLYFPFLLLEAKSGKSDCDWESIRLQSAFPIWTFLQTQQRLRTAAGPSSKWVSGPLVWFLMNRGEDWSVSVAYLSDRTCVS